MKNAILFLIATLATGSLFAQSNITVAEAVPVYKPDTLQRFGPYTNVAYLLRKIKGFEIGDDGTVFHNGQQINIAKINGKSYVGVNIAKVLKTLPANRVQNIEVITDDQVIRKGVEKSASPQEILNVISNAEGSFYSPGYADVQHYGHGGRYFMNDPYIIRYGEPTQTDPRNPSDRYVDRAIINMQAISSSMYDVDEYGDQIPHFVIKEWPGPGLTKAKKKTQKNAPLMPASDQKPVQP